MMQLSEIGGHLTARTGIDDLMEDLFKALHSGDAGLCQLNGGSPAVIPEVTELWRRSMEELVRNGKFDVLVGHYAHPGGDPAFIRALVRFLNERCGWNLTPENVAITQGGQMACFTLFNMQTAAVSGRMSRRSKSITYLNVCPSSMRMPGRMPRNMTPPHRDWDWYPT